MEIRKKSLLLMQQVTVLVGNCFGCGGGGGGGGGGGEGGRKEGGGGKRGRGRRKEGGGGEGKREGAREGGSGRGCIACLPASLVPRCSNYKSKVRGSGVDLLASYLNEETAQ